MENHELCMLKEIGQPFKIKMVEDIRMTSRSERIEALKMAKYNPLKLEADMIAVDLLTDSGVGGLSSKQWAGLITGDESYTGSRSFKRLETIVKQITGFPFVVPAHQGRGAEKILFAAILENKRKSVVLSNGIFETTDNIIKGLDCEPKDIKVLQEKDPVFIGGIDCEKLESILQSDRNNISCVIIVITNNVIFGQPVSMRNIKMAAEICQRHGVPLISDACRFVENAWYIKSRENSYSLKSVKAIVLEMFNYFDAIYVSAKKNGLSNSGGFVCLKEEELYIKVRRKCIINEGHYTYGGMSGRDMEAIASGLEECLDEAYLRYRFDTLEQFAGFLKEAGIPVAYTASSAVFVDARKVIPGVPMSKHPSWTLACALYIEGGVRGFGDIIDSDQSDDFIKLAVPHRLYTTPQLKYVAKVFKRVLQNISNIKGLKVTYTPAFPQKCYEVELEPYDPDSEY